VRLWVLLLFLAGLLLHSVVFFGRHREGDERIYLALVEQLDAGAGYTLQGHPILERPWLSRAQYDEALFHHPPGGPALFWLLHALAGEAGFGLVQLLSFALFFVALLWLGLELLAPVPALTNAAIALLAPLLAFSPIMSHVTAHWWLDGPLLALVSLASASCVAGARRQQSSYWWVAGVLWGLASLVKLTAVMALPPVLWLAYVCSAPTQRRPFWRSCAGMLALAAALQAPWEIWQWMLVGSPLPRGAGRPVPELLAKNAYVHYVTVVRGPLIYVELLPQVLFTLVPSLLLSFVQRNQRWLCARSVPLIGWLFLIAGIHTALGLAGYSKVLRYVILLTPAACLLCSLQLAALIEGLRTRTFQGPRAVALALGAFAGLGAALEMAQGVWTSIHDRDLIVPLLYVWGVFSM
jgi:4-amino-4-deoxy-L-arabinose transferase-like glycosyltransferase